MKPMLAAKFDLDNGELFLKQLSSLDYPLIASPKVDGIRVLADPQLGPVTRSLKAVPNKHIQGAFNRAMAFVQYMDGEITVGPPHTQSDVPNDDVFNRTTEIMGREGIPPFQYHVFDVHAIGGKAYHSRLAEVADLCNQVNTKDTVPWFRLLEHKWVENHIAALAYEQECLEHGYEGIMLRHPEALYKFGRSTLKQQGLIKLKRTTDAEAQIIGVEPRYENQNEQVRDNLGYAKRSSHQENKVALPMLGKFIVKSPAFTETFGVGSGFDHAFATLHWGVDEGKSLIGKMLTFKYQACGTIDRPRHPIFKGFRQDI